jgi:DNA-binding CsgD family transcriptional regulator
LSPRLRTVVSSSRRQAASALAALAAAQDAEDECLAYEAVAVEAQQQRPCASFGLLGSGAAGLLALGRGSFDDAAAAYGPHVIAALGPLKLYPEVADAIEAFVRAGRPGEITALLSEFAAQAAASGWSWAQARAAHLRGLLAEEDDWEPELQAALEWHAQSEEAFPRARTQLLLGQRLRRTGRRMEARPHLRDAISCFEQLGAEPWAEQARAELRGTGERARRRSQPRTSELTPQELQVALIVAGGATNKEAAAQLFLSPKTIEKHLGSVFRKLGLRSRTELAGMFAVEQVAAAGVAG